MELGHSAASCTGDVVASGQDRRKRVPFVLFGSSFPKDKEYTQVCYVCACMSVCVCVCVCVCIRVRACV